MKTKLTPKQKQEKKEFIKKQIFKIIHVIGYVCIFLVALFSILMSVQSCNKKPNNRNASNVLDHNTQLRVNATNTNKNYDLYLDIYNNNGLQGLGGCEVIFDNNYLIDFVLGNEIFKQIGLTQIDIYNVNMNNLLQFFDNTNLQYSFEVDEIRISWDNVNIFIRGYHGNNLIGDLSVINIQTREIISGFVPYRYIKYAQDSFDQGIAMIGHTSGIPSTSLEKVFTDNRAFFYLGNTRYSVNFTYLFANILPLQTDSFKFVDNFNPVSLYSTQLNGAINLTSLTIQQYNTTFSYLAHGERRFLCNGVVYNTMRLVGMDLTDNATYYTTDGESFKIWNLGNSYFVPFYLAYENTNTNVSHAVIYVNQVIRDTNNGTAIYLNSYRWTNEVYKNITILDKDFKHNTNFYTQTTLDLMSVLNNGNNNQIGNITNYTLGTSNNNVFVWLRGAFSSLTDIFAISLLPGVTIGILIFLPMVVTIIIVIFKLIKK